MFRKSPWLAFLAIGLAVALGCFRGGQPTNTDEPPDDVPPIDVPPEDLKALVDGNNRFAIDLYKQVAAKTDGNIILSPYSISSALAMTYAGTRGDTAKEIATTLHFDLEPEKFHPAFATLVKELQGDSKKRKFALSIANRLWGQKDYGFLPEFIKLSQDQYQAGLKEVDFVRATEQARRVATGSLRASTRTRA